MKIFSRLYVLMMRWAIHPYAPRYLAIVAFSESSFFPIPPDVMLIPMSLAKPMKSLQYASLATFFSTLGGIAGYAIGLFTLKWLLPWVESSIYQEQYYIAVSWFQQWGVWVIILAGFSPIPYKIFTVTAGLLSMPFLPFVLASAIGRGGRFYLVAMLLRYLGGKIEPIIYKFIDLLGWVVLFLLIVAYLYYR